MNRRQLRHIKLSASQSHNMTSAAKNAKFIIAGGAALVVGSLASVLVSNTGIHEAKTHNKNSANISSISSSLKSSVNTGTSGENANNSATHTNISVDNNGQKTSGVSQQSHASIHINQTNNTSTSTANNPGSESQNSTTVIVNGKSIPVKNNGSTNTTVNTPNGTIDISANSNQSSSSITINSNSSTTVSGQSP